MRVPVAGTSIAGPTAAYWLVRDGAEVTVVERAPALREGGHDVDVRYVVGDRVAALLQDAGGVDVAFDSGREERFDLVVGADGMRSGVRAATLDPDERCVDLRGYHHAGFTVPNVLGLDHEGVMSPSPVSA